MRFLAVMTMTFLSATSGFANTCPSLDKVIQDAANGVVVSETEYDLTPAAAVASASLCHIQNAGLKMCETRKGLLKELISATEASFRMGETTKDVVVDLQNQLSKTEQDCRK